MGTGRPIQLNSWESMVEGNNGLEWRNENLLATHSRGPAPTIRYAHLSADPGKCAGPQFGGRLDAHCSLPFVGAVQTNFSEIGIDGGVLQDAKENLDLKGRHTITEVILSDEQVGQLGFVDVAA